MEESNKGVITHYSSFKGRAPEHYTTNSPVITQEYYKQLLFALGALTSGAEIP